MENSSFRTKLDESDSETDIGQRHRSLTDYMMPGDRVSGMERADAICGAQYSLNLGAAMQETDVSYYYAIESSTFINGTDMAGMTVIRALEQQLYESISGMILWCYFEESPPVIVRSSGEGGSGRNLFPARARSDNSNNQGDRRRLTLEVARRLGIVTFSPSPFDQERPDSKYENEIPSQWRISKPQRSFVIMRITRCNTFSYLPFFV